MSQLRQIRNLALIGFMGTGKSTVGSMVAQHLRFRYVDTDALIESRLGRPISAIFAQEGEAWFREQERQLVAEFVTCDPTVFATGGGLAANEENLASLKQHALVVCLWASPETIWERVKCHSHRPLLQTPDPKASVQQLLVKRIPFYRQADVLINTEQRSLRQVVQNVLHQFQIAMTAHPSRPGTLTVLL
jgi:shikimate kinase